MRLRVKFLPVRELGGKDEEARFLRDHHTMAVTPARYVAYH